MVQWSRERIEPWYCVLHRFAAIRHIDDFGDIFIGPRKYLAEFTNFYLLLDLYISVSHTALIFTTSRISGVMALSLRSVMWNPSTLPHSESIRLTLSHDHRMERPAPTPIGAGQLHSEPSVVRYSVYLHQAPLWATRRCHLPGSSETGDTYKRPRI